LGFGAYASTDLPHPRSSCGFKFGSNSVKASQAFGEGDLFRPFSWVGWCEAKCGKPRPEPDLRLTITLRPESGNFSEPKNDPMTCDFDQQQF